MSSEWNFAEVWEAVAQAVPDRLAQVHGQRSINWRDFDASANGIASTLLRAGLARQDKVALYLHNGPEYLQSAFACMKAGLVPVNTNYRYQQDELHYLWDNADAAAVIFHGTFTETVEGLRARCGKVRLWIHVDDGAAACPAWALSFDRGVIPLPERVVAPWGRSGDDLILVYTGGTTGRPCGVMWRQHDLYVASNTTADPALADLTHVRRRIAHQRTQGIPPPVGLPAAPLMHGTAFVFASTILNRAGSVVTLTKTQFDVQELLGAIQHTPVTDLCIVGDAFCRPMVDALDAAPGRWNITSLKAVSSSGMMWSNASKQRLLEHAPHALLIDFLNSSEASGMGRSISSRDRANPPSRFKLGQNAFVIGPDDRPPDNQLEPLLDSFPFERLTTKTVSSRRALVAGLKEVRKHRVSTVDSGTVAGVVAVAAPIFGADGQVSAAVSVGGPTARLARRLPVMQQAVRDGAEEISRVLGYRGEWPNNRSGK